MDKQKKRKSLVIPDSRYENITSSSVDHHVLNKKNERPIHKYRHSEIPFVHISNLDMVNSHSS